MTQRLNDRLRVLLERTDQEICQLISDAAKQRDLDVVDRAQNVARELRRLIASLDGATVDLVDPPAAAQVSTSRAARRKRFNPRKSRGYPRFRIRSATLYRTGWSRKKNAEYEQKAPKSTVEDVLDSMSSLAKDGEAPVAAERIISKVNQKSVLSVPQYQIYLIIGWLRATDVIEQVGRDGYRIPHDVREAGERAWESMFTPE